MRKIAAYLLTASLIVLGLMFSALLFAVIAVIAVIAWCYLWWKTRDLRKLMRDQQEVFERNEHQEFRGEIIEGEVIREVIEKIER